MNWSVLLGIAVAILVVISAIMFLVAFGKYNHLLYICWWILSIGILVYIAICGINIATWAISIVLLILIILLKYEKSQQDRYFEKLYSYSQGRVGQMVEDIKKKIEKGEKNT